MGASGASFKNPSSTAGAIVAVVEGGDIGADHLALARTQWRGAVDFGVGAEDIAVDGVPGERGQLRHGEPPICVARGS